jgi:hypothetical protein
MGGGSEDDAAATLFVESASGGDIVILRATGSTTSYPSYFVQTLSPNPGPASAITIRTDQPASAGHEAVPLAAPAPEPSPWERPPLMHDWGR